MNWTIKFSSIAENKYKKHDKKTKERIKHALEDLAKAENPKFHKHVKPLVGQLKGFYRLRVGNLRVIFYIIAEDKIIAVVNIVPRGDAYK